MIILVADDKWPIILYESLPGFRRFVHPRRRRLSLQWQLGNFHRRDLHPKEWQLASLHAEAVPFLEIASAACSAICKIRYFVSFLGLAAQPGRTRALKGFFFIEKPTLRSGTEVNRGIQGGGASEG
jgi:hypothetical protein